MVFKRLIIKTKNMKKLLALSLIFAALTLSVNAQNTKTTKSVKSETVQTDSKPGKKGMMAEKLGLTTDQKAKMKEVHQNFKTKKEAIKNDASLTESAKAEKLKALHSEKKESVAKILTKEQQDKMKEIKKNRNKKRNSKR